MAKLIAAHPRLVRDLNEINILHLVRERGPISRIEIAQQLGLSQTAVSRIVGHLIRSDFLVEEMMSSATRSVGRQRIALRFNPNVGHVLAMDIGRKTTTLALANLGGTILARKAVESELDRGRDGFLERVTATAVTFLASQGIGLSQIEGLGVTIPGVVAAPQGVIRTFDRWKDWVGFNLQGYLERKLGVHTHVEGDVRAIAIAEHLIGAGKASDNMVCLCVTEVGPSAGIIYNGQLIRGVTDSAGEVGTTLVGYYIKDSHLYRSLFQEDQNVLFDQVVQPSTLLAIAKREIEKGLEIKSRDANLNVENLTVSQIVRAAEGGDRFCQLLLQEFGAIVGALCINLINFINPDLIVLHGEMFWAGTVALQAVRETVQKHVLPLPVEAVKIVPSALKEDGYILGGVSLVLRDLFNPPKFDRDTFRSPRKIRPFIAAPSS